jgi:hypothetical protein
MKINYHGTLKLLVAVFGLWKGSCGTPVAVAVPISSGIFSVLLGDTSYASTNALDLSFNDDNYWLQVEVEGEKNSPSRRRIGAVGYAYNSEHSWMVYTNRLLLFWPPFWWPNSYSRY